MSIAQVKQKAPLAECWRCPLKDARVAPSSGPKDATVAVVSRSPGYYDCNEGRPFAGPSGKVLDHLLKRHGYERDQILTTNVVLCETDNPPVEAIEACKPRLLSELARADTIIAAGTEATSLLTRYRSVSRGRGFEHGKGSQRVVVTNNPAMVLRNSDSFPDMVADFRLALAPLPPPTFPEVEIINEPVQAGTIIRRWLDTEFDYLASDLEWRSHEIVCAGFSRTGGKAVVLGWSAIREREIGRLLRSFYERDDIRFVWHNGQADTKILRLNSIKARIDDDTFLASYALDERPGVHALEYMLMDNFGWPDYEPESVKHFKKTGELTDEEALYKYNGWDAAGTSQLFQKLRPQLEAEGLVDHYEQNLLPVARAFIDVELNGFNFDVEQAANINEEKVLPRLSELQAHLREVSNHPLYNPRSPKQSHAIMYREWGLKHGLRNMGRGVQAKVEDSTGKAVRDEIAAGRFKCKSQYREQLVAFAKTLDTFSKIDKQRGTYIEGLIERVDNNGKLYCDFNPCGTVTGRPSSKNPNFQNVTREGREGIPGIRTLFRPSKGHRLVGADYNQAELRACAVLSGDKSFLAVYKDTFRSLHRERAAAFYGSNYTKEQYVKSKNINFGVTYGQSAAGFAQMYAMPEDEAQAYINSWWAEFPQLKTWTEATRREVRKNGVITSPFGHKRRFHLITNENLGDVLREAVNFRPQNVAAWLTLHSVIELVANGVRIVTTVHDSIVADVPADLVSQTAKLMKSIMESMPKRKLGWDLPFLVDISVGENWGSMKEVNE